VQRFSALSYGLIAAVFFLLTAGLLMAQGEPATSQPSASQSSTESLNYEFFKDKVEPIFLAKRPGHARCISCHSANRVRLHLVPLSPGASTWDESQSRENFELIKRVAFPGNLQSPLLIHPLLEQAGGDFFHSGGKHFNSQNDPEWLTLKAFVLGETTKQGQ
jgi:hypothetical protein